MFPYMGCGVLEEDMKQHLQEYTYIYVRAHTREHAHTLSNMMSKYHTDN